MKVTVIKGGKSLERYDKETKLGVNMTYLTTSYLHSKNIL